MDDFLDIKTTLDSIYIQIIDSHKNYITTFIDSNPHSLASLIALYQVLGQQPVLSEKEDFTYFEKLADGLIQKYPNNPHSIDLYNRVEEIREFLVEKAEAEKRMGIGNVSPEVSLNNPNGETIHLSSYRGKFVLVNFWASWCAPCRKSNPELVKLHNKYKSKNFEIFSVSLDRNKEAWTAAIELDKLDWVHVSDLAYWSSPIVKLFNIDSIPASYLIDKDGKILYHNLDYKTLDNVLKNLL